VLSLVILSTFGNRLYTRITMLLEKLIWVKFFLGPLGSSSKSIKSACLAHGKALDCSPPFIAGPWEEVPFEYSYLHLSH
jgi:hypothetical protein